MRLLFASPKIKIDRHENRLMNLCKSTQLFFVNGRFVSDRGIGQNTCNNSLIGYVTVTPDLSKTLV